MRRLNRVTGQKPRVSRAKGIRACGLVAGHDGSAFASYKEMGWFIVFNRMHVIIELSLKASIAACKAMAKSFDIRKACSKALKLLDWLAANGWPRTFGMSDRVGFLSGLPGSSALAWPKPCESSTPRRVS